MIKVIASGKAVITGATLPSTIEAFATVSVKLTDQGAESQVVGDKYVVFSFKNAAANIALDALRFIDIASYTSTESDRKSVV